MAALGGGCRPGAVIRERLLCGSEHCRLTVRACQAGGREFPPLRGVRAAGRVVPMNAALDINLMALNFGSQAGLLLQIRDLALITQGWLSSSARSSAA